MKATAIAGVSLLVLLVVTGALLVMRTRDPDPAAPLLPVLGRRDEGARAPDGVRVRVQVMNTTTTRGQARRATRLLRDRGFDVVEIGTTRPALDSTLVLDRSGHPDWATQVAAVMTPARTESRPDTSRYLDVTVLVGRLWVPPAQPLYP